MLRGTPVIINTTDCPEAKLVAVLIGFDAKRGVWKARYLSPSARMVYCWSSQIPTPLSDFGLKVEVDSAGCYRCVPTGEPCIATYEDGKPRHWQGRSDGSRWFHSRKQAIRLLMEKR